MPANRPEAALAAVLSFAVRPLPLLPLERMLTAFIVRLGRNHPNLFNRLGSHAAKTFAVDPEGYPFVFLIRPNPHDPRVLVRRSVAGQNADACIRGRLPSLVALAEGKADGDALFFSRRLAIEGDVEAVLALRNAIDDARLDLTHEATSPLGPLAVPAQRLVRMAMDMLSPADHAPSEQAPV
jgi:predicted lipid carrier protein YhbT